VFDFPSSGTLEVDTCGTNDGGGVDEGTDTFLSLHSGGPGNTRNELAVNNDWASDNDESACLGLDQGLLRDSAVRRSVRVAKTIYIRVSHAYGCATAPFQLHVSFVAPEPDAAAAALGSGAALAVLARRRRFELHRIHKPASEKSRTVNGLCASVPGSSPGRPTSRLDLSRS